MAKSNALLEQEHASGEPVATAEILFKPDRPRTIDRYIDYFGGRPGASRPDPCSQGLLDAVGDHDEEDRE